MGESHYGNAMTEIALALAMGFFSIMVLTIVSMGAGRGDAADATAKTVIAAALAPAARDAAEAAKMKPSAEDVLVIYHRGRFYDRDLRVLDPIGRVFPGRVVLALEGTLTMGEALAARGRIGAGDLVVSTLDERWMKALGRLSNKEN